MRRVGEVGGVAAGVSVSEESALVAAKRTARGRRGFGKVWRPAPWLGFPIRENAQRARGASWGLTRKHAACDGLSEESSFWCRFPPTLGG